MKSMNRFHRRSCYDRRSINDRRGRWWRVFRRKKAFAANRTENERRITEELRSSWERIGKWCSAPKIHPYRDPFLTGVDGAGGYPYW